MSLETYLTICDERYAMCCESDGFVVVEVNNVECPSNVPVSPDLLRLTKAPKVPHLHEETGHRLEATDSTRLQTRKALLERRETSVQERMVSFAAVIKNVDGSYSNSCLN